MKKSPVQDNFTCKFYTNFQERNNILHLQNTKQTLLNSPYRIQFSSVQSLSHVWLCDPMNHSTPGLPVHHQLLESPKPMSIESVMPSNHLILCCPLLLLPSIFPSIIVFSNESALRIRWPKYWSFSFNIGSSSEHSGLISFRMDWLDLLVSQGASQESSPTPQFKSINSSAQHSSQSDSHIHTWPLEKPLPGLDGPLLTK